MWHPGLGDLVPFCTLLAAMSIGILPLIKRDISRRYKPQTLTVPAISDREFRLSLTG
jgi:hypothetical protein